jgi:twitching motility protein PilT
LRQAPKVILVGEMRDRETVEIGLTAAETGHLVLFHLAHRGCRSDHQPHSGHVHQRRGETGAHPTLADTIRWVVSQRLLPKIGGGRVAAFEVLRSNLRVKEAILNGESEGKTYYEMMQAGRPFGMTTFDDYIVGLYEQGLITQETALAYASNKAVASRGIDKVKSARAKPPPISRTWRSIAVMARYPPPDEE